MKKNIIILLLSIIVVLLLITIKQQSTKQAKYFPVEQQTTQLQKQQKTDNKQEFEDLKQEIAIQKEKISQLKQQLAAVKKTSSRQLRPGNTGNRQLQANNNENTNQPQNPDINSLMKQLRDQGLIPAQNNQDMAPPTLEEKYLPLISNLGLSDEKSRQLLDLLKGYDNPLINHSVAENKIRELLGDEDYKKFQEYERTLPTRLFVDDLAIRMANAGYALTEEQAKAMLQLDPDVIKDIPLSYTPATITLNNLEGSNNGDINEMVDNKMSQTADKFDKTVAKADEILSDKQMKIMHDYLDERFRAQEETADTAAQILPEIISREFLQKISEKNTKNKTTITILPAVKN